MSWLTSSWYDLADRALVFPLLVLVAIGAGSLVGFEREKQEKPAGLRTLTLVSLGSALFTMASRLLEPGDGRIASQVVSGIGFLGAGAILRGAHGVSGMTSAATIWVVAAIGMLVGAGYGAAGVVLAALTFVVLAGVARVEHRYNGPCVMRNGEARFDAAGGKTAVRIRDLLDEQRSPEVVHAFGPAPEGSGRLTFSWCVSHRQHREFVPKLAAMDEIVELRLDPSPHGPLLQPGS